MEKLRGQVLKDKSNQFEVLTYIDYKHNALKHGSYTAEHLVYYQKHLSSNCNKIYKQIFSWIVSVAQWDANHKQH